MRIYKPSCIPSEPSRSYKDRFSTWPSFLAGAPAGIPVAWFERFALGRFGPKEGFRPSKQFEEALCRLFRVTEFSRGYHFGGFRPPSEEDAELFRYFLPHLMTAVLSKNLTIREFEEFGDWAFGYLSWGLSYRKMDGCPGGFLHHLENIDFHELDSIRELINFEAYKANGGWVEEFYHKLKRATSILCSIEQRSIWLPPNRLVSVAYDEIMSDKLILAHYERMEQRRYRVYEPEQPNVVANPKTPAPQKGTRGRPGLRKHKKSGQWFYKRHGKYRYLGKDQAVAREKWLQECGYYGHYVAEESK